MSAEEDKKIEEYKLKYNLVPENDPILHQRVEEFDFNNPPVDPEELAIDVINHMGALGGIGLSANQLGLPYRMFTMAGEPPFACFNPRITFYDEEDILLDEGCLSFPLLWLKIKRPKMIRVRFQDPYGNWCTKRFVGMAARIFQHEMDHMEGLDYTRLVSKFVLDRAITKRKKLYRKKMKIMKQNMKILRKQR